MKADFFFSFQQHWRHAPLAYWVHVPVPHQPDNWAPPAPPLVPHKGYVFLHVVFEKHELVFSSPAQLDHFIRTLSAKPLPTTRHLSALRGTELGPNSHWLSRLPASLKAPRKRVMLVEYMQEIRSLTVNADTPLQFEWKNQNALPMK